MGGSKTHCCTRKCAFLPVSKHFFLDQARTSIRGEEGGEDEEE